MTDARNQAALIAAYKELLRDYLEKRPSGVRKKISDAIGTNRSFVSQITNPKYTVPLPAQYLHKIIELCHLTPAERTDFLAAYADAHPGQMELVQHHAPADGDQITIDLSAVQDEASRNLIRQTLKYTAESLIALAQGKGRSAS